MHLNLSQGSVHAKLFALSAIEYGLSFYEDEMMKRDSSQNDENIIDHNALDQEMHAIEMESVQI